MKKITKYLPVIFSALASVGVVATGILSAKAEVNSREQMPNKLIKERLKKTWKCYIPPVIVGASTVVCITISNGASNYLYSSLLSAYIAADKTHKLYVNKNIEINGKDSHEKVIKAIHVEQVKNAPPICDIFVSSCSLDFDEPTEDEYRLFYEPISNRYFKSTKDRVIQAQYHLNRNLMLRGWCSLNEFFTFLGLDETKQGDILGWNNFEDVFWIDFNNGELITEDGVSALVIDYAIDPEPGFDDGI